MKRRDFLRSGAAGLLVNMIPTNLFLGGNLFAQKNAKKRPNVLFIAVDDLRPTLGCYGDKNAITPNIDAIAANGIVFNRAYCQQAVCNPSRSSLLTGRRPDTIKVWDNHTHFRQNVPDIVTLPQYFKQNGYHTQSIGKIFHDPRWAKDPISWSVPETLAVTDECGGKYLLDKNLHKVKGWKASATECADVSDYAYIDGRVADAAIQILKEIKNKEFFLAVGFRRPHLPYSAPKKYWDLYDRNKIAPPANPKPPIDVPEIALHNWKELRGYTDIPDKGELSPEKIAELRHGYYAATSYTDALIGKLIEQLKLLGLFENTIIILWGDHGYHLGEHDLWAKTTNFELDTRAPLIISYPNQTNKGVKTNSLVEFVDIYPTLVDLCGLPMPSGLEGISMKPLIEHPNRQWKKAVFSQFPRPFYGKKQFKLMGYTTRTDRYRYTEWKDIKTGKVIERELYDHRTDPLETVNLAHQPKYKGTISQLSKVLNTGWHGALPDGVSN